MKKNTNELQTELDNTSSLKQFLEKNQTGFQKEKPADLLQSMITRKKLKKAVIARNAGISEVYLYQILSGSRKPSRNRLLCLCISMQAGLEETQELLKQSGQALLYPKFRRDAVIMYGLMHQLELTDVNDLLFDAGEETLTYDIK